MKTDFEMNNQPYCVEVDAQGRHQFFKYTMLGTLRMGRVPVVGDPALYKAYELWRKVDGDYAGMEMGEFLGKVTGPEESKD